MKLERIHLRYAPGLSRGLPEVTIGDGLTFIIGPNASGKSTLARTMRLAFWTQQSPPSIDASVTAKDDGGVRRSAEIQAGRVSAPLAGSHREQGAASLYRLGLAELLQAGNAADERFAQQLQTELHGGIPVAKMREDLRSGQTKHTAPKKDLRAARKEIEEARRTNTKLLSDEQELKRLTLQRDEAQNARQLEAATGMLLTALDHHDKFEELKSELATLPARLEDVRADDLESKQDAEQKFRSACLQRDQKKAELESFQQRLNQIDAAWTLLARESVNTGEKVYAGLEEQGTTVREWESSLRVHESQLRTAENRLFAGPLERPVPPGVAGQLKTAFDSVQRSRSTFDALTDVTDYFDSIESTTGAEESGSSEAGPEETVSAESLQHQIHALRDWLRIPERRKEKSSGWTSVVVAVLTACSLATVIAEVVLRPGVIPPLMILAVLIGLLILLLAIWQCLRTLWSSKRLDKEVVWETSRPQAQRAAEKAGVSLAAWTPDAVESRLRSAESALISAREAVRESERIRQRQNEARAKREEAEGRWIDARATLESAVADAGLQPDVMGLEAAEVFYRTERWIEAEQAYGEAKAELESARGRQRQLTQQWSDWLEQHSLQTHAGEVGESAIVDVARRQIDDVRTLRRDLDEARSALDREEQVVEAAESGVSRLKQRLGVWFESETELKHAIDQSKRRQQLHTACSVAEQHLTRSFEQLRTYDALLADAGVVPHGFVARESFKDTERAAVEQMNEQYRRQAEELGELIERVSRLSERLDVAKRGHGLEDAHAALELATLRSAEQAERRGLLMLEELMLDWSARGAGDSGGSESLAHADGWLRRFTHGRFGLRLSLNGDLVGFDVEAGEQRALAELSDATRVQSLFAGRLAAIRDAEAGGEKLPLVLDEVFSTTDPERFEAIAQAMSDLVESGRQVIYLTADPGEWTRWKALRDRAKLVEPQVVWLGRLDRDDHAGVSGVGLPEFEEIPEPAGRSATEYAQLLSVRAPDMSQRVERWPLLWLLPDELAAVCSALQHRLSSVGPALDFVGPLDGASAGTRIWGTDASSASEVTARLARRRNMLRAMQRRWAQGTARAFRWSDVEASGAVSDAFAERAQNLYAEYSSRPERFIEEVGDLSRFRTSNKEALSDYFSEQGILAELAPAAGAELRDVAMRAVDAATCDAGDIAWLNGLVTEVVG